MTRIARSGTGREIVEGCALAVEALSGAAVGAFALQAAIAACYARAASLESVDWDRVLALYDLLTQAEPSPVIKLKSGGGAIPKERSCRGPGGR